MSDLLFPDPPEPRRGLQAPLADRMRPRSLDEVLGQQHLIAQGKVLREMIEHDQLASIILWGPPGTGKTTLARIIAKATKSEFVSYSAVLSGIKEIKVMMADAETHFRRSGRKTIVFIDEIHRFNKAQQDAFLHYVESGVIVLIGATTENPSFEVISALLSRAKVYVLNPLKVEDVEQILRRALQDPERGLAGRPVEVAADILRKLAIYANGDARMALNALEIAVELAFRRAGTERPRLTAADLESALQHKFLRYDKAGDEHYNLISALHKSMRNSDPDAALYWMGRMLEGGEDPVYIARRMVRFASEDVGLADPRALRVALDAKEAFDFLGNPEGVLAIVEAAAYCALAPKSNALYSAEGKARSDIEEFPQEPVPPVIRNAVTKLMKKVGYGRGYRYAHDEPEGVGGVECLPESLLGRRYYEPKGAGEEKEIVARLKEIRALRERKKGS
jgi:putative ATPase